MLNLESRQTTKRGPSVILVFLFFFVFVCLFVFEEVNTYTTDFKKYREVVIDTYWAQIPFSNLISQLLLRSIINCSQMPPFHEDYLWPPFLRRYSLP